MPKVKAFPSSNEPKKKQKKGDVFPVLDAIEALDREEEKEEKKRYFCAPEVNSEDEYSGLNVFLAGGIKDCPDWQTDFAKKVLDIRSNIRVYNPRRPKFDDTSDAMLKEQISWEYEAINRCEMILFWFPKEGQCMTTLYELGRCEEKLRDGEAFVGIEDGYVMKNHVIKQLQMIDSDFVVSSTLEELFASAEKDLNTQALYRHV